MGLTLEDAIDRSSAVVILIGKHGIGNTSNTSAKLRSSARSGTRRSR